VREEAHSFANGGLEGTAVGRVMETVGGEDLA